MVGNVLEVKNLCHPNTLSAAGGRATGLPRCCPGTGAASPPPLSSWAQRRISPTLSLLKCEERATRKEQTRD